MGRDGSSLPGDKAGDREVQPREQGLVTPLLQYCCVHAGFPFPLAPWVPFSQTDGMGLHICPAAIVVLVVVPIPSSACGLGFWGSPCCASPLLFCQGVLGSLSCWGAPGADTARYPTFPSEKLVQVKERASVCWRLCLCRSLGRSRTRNQQTHFQR